MNQSRNITKAKRHLARAREISSRAKSPFAGMSESAIIAKIRRDRDAIWRAKLDSRS